MKESVDLIVVIPVGPGCQPAFVTDTINSIQFYVHSTYKIILVDDSHKGTGKLIRARFSEIDVLTTPQPMGKLCGLYMTLSMAFTYALDLYRFDALLRIDTDALLIGEAPEQAAIELFKADPRVGMAGQYPLDYNGIPWDTSWPRSQLREMSRPRYFLKAPYMHALLLNYYRRAKKHGYQRGESVFGGACFFSAACLRQLHSRGLLPHPGFKKLELEEDHLFSLLVCSIGFKLGSLSGRNMPLGCAWQGLPASPEELIANNKKIIHSTRFWKGLQEEELRAWFREQRRVAIINQQPLCSE